MLLDFKSFARETAAIAPFTLLVGANASGKSNFVEALRFLHGLAQGWSVREALGGRVVGGVRVWEGIRGGTQDAVRTGCDRFSIASRWQIMHDGYNHSLTANGDQLFSEDLGSIFTATYDPDSDHEEPMRVEFLAGSEPREFRAPETTSVMAMPRGPERWAGRLRATLQMMRFLDLQPRRMREFNEKRAGNGRPQLADDGSNISHVLWALARDDKTRRELVDWLGEFCAPEIADLDFEETESGEVRLRVIEHDGTKVAARSLSDGTLRFLGLLAALKTAGPGTTLVVEDLDHGLHPSRLQLLVEAVESVTDWDPASEHETPVVLATTHSPTLLEAAFRRASNSIQLFARPPGAPTSLIRDVRTLPGIDDVLKRRDFGYLFHTLWLERSA